ncbi:annexin [Trichonephila clavipes]|nr:annexin [Trichonephila clavipes]
MGSDYRKKWLPKPELLLLRASVACNGESRIGALLCSSPDMPSIIVTTQLEKGFVTKRYTFPGTITAAENFNAERAAAKLRKAMKGTDERAIIDVLVTHSNSQRQEIKRKYKSLYGRFFGEYNRKQHLTIEIIRIMILLGLSRERDEVLGSVPVSPCFKTSLSLIRVKTTHSSRNDVTGLAINQRHECASFELKNYHCGCGRTKRCLVFGLAL